MIRRKLTLFQLSSLVLLLLIFGCGQPPPEKDTTSTNPISPTNTSNPVSPTPTALPDITPTPQTSLNNIDIPDCDSLEGQDSHINSELSFELEPMDSYRFHAIYRYKAGEEYAEDELSIDLIGEYSGLLSEPETLLFTELPSQRYSRSHTILTDLSSASISESIITEEGVWIRPGDSIGWIELKQGSPSHFYNNAELFAWDEMVKSHIEFINSASKIVKRSITIDVVETTHRCFTPEPIGIEGFDMVNSSIGHGSGLYTFLEDAEYHLWTIDEDSRIFRLAVVGKQVAYGHAEYGFLEKDQPNDFLLWVEWSDLNQDIEIELPLSADIILSIPDEDGVQNVDSDAQYDQLPLPPVSKLVSESEKELLEELWSDIYENGITPDNAVVFKDREFSGMANRFEDKLLSNSFDSHWYNLPLDRSPIYETDVDISSLIMFYAENMNDLGWYLEDAGFQNGPPNMYYLFFTRDNLTLPIIIEDRGEEKSRIRALLPPDDKWFDAIQSGWEIFNESNSIIPKDLWITSLAVDQKGRAWIGCWALDECSYSLEDGKWTDYSDLLPEMQIPLLAMDIDQEGRLWIGSSAGIFIFDGESWLDLSEGAPSMKETRSNLIIDNDNNVWVTSEAGISVFDGSNWRTYQHEFTVIDFDVDFEGRPWIITWDREIYSLERDTWIEHEVPGYIFSETSTSSETIINFDSLGRLWVLYHGNYLAVYDGETWKTINFAETGLSIYSDKDFTIDQYDRVWLVTQEGLFMLDTNDNWVDLTPYGSGATIDSALVITHDQQGGIWIGSIGGIANFSPPLP